MKQLLTLIILILAVQISKGQAVASSTFLTDTGETKNGSLIPVDSNQFYFPLEVFRDTSSYKGREVFIDKWYSKHLFAMKEPLIYSDPSPKAIYRLTWLRTFHNPVAIRIEKNGNTYQLYWKVSSGAGGYKPGKLTIDKRKVIDKSLWNKFQNQLHELQFWTLKTNEKISGNDGSQWILEGKVGKLYHVVDRWTPNTQSNYYRCCNYLIELTDLNISGNAKY